MLRVNNLFAGYGKTDVLHGVSLEVKAGQCVLLIGANGAGKSTTIKILTGIIPEFEGEANVLGMDVRKDIMEIKKHIGYCSATNSQ